jgi:crotonobetainyl-CoA:carnitine CoA-transferase CaiB-like acyl-CoA transferase
MDIPRSPIAPDAAPAGARALSGIRVVDLSRVLAGPLCTQMLADHGAEVVKVEPPVGDDTRALGPPFLASGDAAYFAAVNRGKRAIAVDLGVPQGRELVMRLLEGADVLVENFLPGTMQRWGMGFEEVLAERFPRLIYCSISGFGADGPLGGLPGYDAIAQAIGGVMSINGSPAEGATRLGVPMVDILTGYNALVGILLAMAERSRSGRGQRVDATLFDSALSMLMPHAANWFANGRTPGLLGSGHPNISPYDKFRAGERELFLGVVNDGQFRRLCERLQRDDLAADPRFASNAQRLAHRDALRAELEREFEHRDADALCAELMRHGVPAGPVNTVPQALSHPHTAHRAMVAEAGGSRVLGVSVKLSRTPGAIGDPAPTFAAHTDAVLVAAGYTPAEIAALRSDGVVVDRRAGSGPAPAAASRETTR